MYQEVSKQLLDFLAHSPTAFQAVDNMRTILKDHDFEELTEGSAWSLTPGHNYFVTRNNSSIIAFKLGRDLSQYSFNIATAHSDSPSYKLKENYELEVVDHHYMQLNTEGYGGMIDSSWFDRPLSVAGRVLVRSGDEIVTRLVNIDRDLLMIPNVAIHMNRKVNDGFSYNKQVDLLPLLGGSETKPGDLQAIIAKALEISEKDIIGTDLFLYNRQQPSIWGAHNEFISAGHLDDLQCAFSALQALLAGYNDRSIDVMAIFDNEEVGSGTKQGADSTFLYDTLTRINSALGKTPEDYLRAIASSFMLSADNAHAVHPNHPEHTDQTNCVYMNEGVVVKQHAGQKYCSDGVSIALFKEFAKQANVPLQFFANRSDKAGGSTLGNISQAHVSLNSVDIGLPQLAMHSAYETAGIKDTYYMIEVMKEVFNAHIEEISSSRLKVTH